MPRVSVQNKFNTPKYRLVVRISNRYVLCQITWATIKGDQVLCTATSKELPEKYSLPGKFGLKNWAACYATGRPPHLSIAAFSRERAPQIIRPNLTRFPHAR